MLRQMEYVSAVGMENNLYGKKRNWIIRIVVKYALSKTILRKSFKIYRNNQNIVYF